MARGVGLMFDDPHQRSFPRKLTHVRRQRGDEPTEVDVCPWGKPRSLLTSIRDPRKTGGCAARCPIARDLSERFVPEHMVPVRMC